jgi:hypothetical protein
VFAGLTDEASKALFGLLPPKIVTHVSDTNGVQALRQQAVDLKAPPLIWGRDRIGIGLLKALRFRTNIEFLDAASPIESVPSKSGHLVVCEAGENLSEVIAANYAYALGAGLCIVPEVDRNTAEEILERLYSVYEDRQTSPTLALEHLKRELQELCGPLTIPPSGSITFVTGRLPYGFRNRRACVGRHTTALRRSTTICRTGGPLTPCGGSRGSAESLPRSMRFPLGAFCPPQAHEVAVSR